MGARGPLQQVRREHEQELVNGSFEQGLVEAAGEAMARTYWMAAVHSSLRPWRTCDQTIEPSARTPQPKVSTRASVR